MPALCPTSPEKIGAENATLITGPKKVCLVVSGEIVQACQYTLWDTQPFVVLDRYYEDDFGNPLDGDLVPCVVEPDCTPAISSYTGDTLAPKHPFDVISISNPTCCAVRITTDTGVIVVPPMTNYASEVFSCDVLQAVAEFVDDLAACSLADVHVILQKTR